MTVAQFQNPTDFVRYLRHSDLGSPFVRGSTVVCVADRVVNRLQTADRIYFYVFQFHSSQLLRCTYVKFHSCQYAFWTGLGAAAFS